MNVKELYDNTQVSLYYRNVYQDTVLMKDRYRWIFSRGYDKKDLEKFDFYPIIK